jgi:hypothetical protein
LLAGFGSRKGITEPEEMGFTVEMNLAVDEVGTDEGVVDGEASGEVSLWIRTASNSRK